MERRKKKGNGGRITEGRGTKLLKYKGVGWGRKGKGNGGEEES